MVAHVSHDRQIVRDEEIGQPQCRLKIDEKIENLRLHRNVQRANRLVAHEQPRFAGQRAGDADPLSLTTR